MTWVPEACTLPTEEQPLRVTEFDQLFALSLAAVQRHGPARISLLLAGGNDVLLTARDLADRETSCCSFFTFAVHRTGGYVEMHVEVPPTRAAVLASLADRAESILSAELR